MTEEEGKEEGEEREEELPDPSRNDAGIYAVGTLRLVSVLSTFTVQLPLIQFREGQPRHRNANI